MTASIRSGATSSALQVNGVDALNFNAGGAERKIESITCTQASGALTFTLNPTVLSFRSTTLTTGVPTTVNIDSAITLSLPSGGTLGFVTTVQGRAILVAINNAGTPELAVINLTGGNDLSETGVINTTTSSAGSTANNVFYSTTARTGVTYRVVGAIDAVNTAGAWATPVLVQGMGGNALAVMGSLGYGQTWKSSTLVSGTTYYTTGKPKWLQLQSTNSTSITSFVVGGVSMLPGNTSAGNTQSSSYLIPPYTPYVITVTSGTVTAFELS